MSFGAATSRLRKSLLFKFAKILELDTCYRCKEKITKIEEFSIEHTVSWQFSSTPVETFFDLDKIEFSHLICNISQGRKNPKTGRGNNAGTISNRKRLVVDGKVWCNRGKHNQVIELFVKDIHTSSGYKSTCNPCRKSLYQQGLSR